MDVISLGKAKKTFRYANQLSNETVAPLAESRFPTIDHRLDWLESQASKIKASNSKSLDFSLGTFINTELVNGKLQLKQKGQVKGETTDIITGGWTTNVYGFESNNLPEGDTVIANGSTIEWEVNGENAGTGTVVIEINNVVVRLTIIDNNIVSGVDDFPIEVDGSSSVNVKVSYDSGQGGSFSYTLNINKLTDIPSYISQGTWESPIIDLGEGWIETTGSEILETLPTTDTLITYEIAYSEDGNTFSAYETFNSENLPQTRYIKIKATLVSNNATQNIKTLNFDQSNAENTFILNEFTQANSQLELKNNYSYTDDTPTTEGAGKIYDFTIDRTQFKSINSISVN